MRCWEASGQLDYHKKKLIPNEMTAFCSGIINGFIIGLLTGAFIVAVIIKNLQI